ncbi:MAG: V-type ATPase 116kDa subunit family protein [Anaerolineae bacterium]|nr:V-type ATPase 116kDa subunit family protein [Anaerolineae bacterium]
MSKIELVLPESQIVPVMEILGNSGNFQQVDMSHIASEYRTGEKIEQDWAVKASSFAALERRLSSLMRTLDIDVGTPYGKTIPPITNERMIYRLIEGFEMQVNDLLSDIESEHEREDQLRAFIRLLKPLKEVDFELDRLQNLDYVFLILGVGPINGLDRLKTSLSHIPFELLVLDDRGDQAVVLLAGPRQNADVLERSARSAFITPLEIPKGYHGTPAEMIDAMSQDLEKLEQQIVGQEGEIDDIRQSRKRQLQQIYWQVRKSNMIATAINRFGKLRYTYLVVGWMPTDLVDGLHKKLTALSADILFEAVVMDRNASDSQETPSSLEHKGLFKAFQSLVTIYGQPKYGEVDPSILLAITFPILFGAMFGDAGQGLFLTLIGGLLASKKIKSLRNASNLGIVVMICGISAALFGLAYGSVFGMEDIVSPLWMRPMENIMQILMITIVGGIVILASAFGLNMFNAVRNKDWTNLIFSNHGISGFVLFLGIIGLGAGFLAPDLALPTPVFIGMAGVASLAIMLSEPMGRLMNKQKPILENNLLMFFIQAFFELFETVISIFSNILSYVRVGAFAVAHVGLSAVIFILAEMVSANQGIGYWIVVILGNLFIIGFEGMIVGIQTLRLEYYEFFSKFFSGGGNPFRPIKLDRSNT